MSAISLGFVGDVCLGGGMRSTLARLGAGTCFDDARNLFSGLDVVCGNLECCIVHTTPPHLPKNVMQVPSAFAVALENSGIGVWSLANNHVMDGGAEGLAASEGRTWNDLGPDDQLAYYVRARVSQEC